MASSPVQPRPSTSRYGPAGAAGPVTALAAAVRPLMRGLGNSHLLLRGGMDLWIAVPRRLVQILRGKVDVPQPSDGEEAIVVFTTRTALARRVGSLSGVTGMMSLETGLQALHIDPPFSLDEASSFRLLPLMGKPAAKLGLLIMRATAHRACEQFEILTPGPAVPCSVPDGGGDALIRIGDHFFWLQWSGGETISIIPDAKLPRYFGRNFFRTAEGDLLPGALKWRRRLYGDLADAHADVIQLAINKAAPVRGPLYPVRGVTREAGIPAGARPRTLWTYSTLLLVLEEPVPETKDAEPPAEGSASGWQEIPRARVKHGHPLSRWTR